MIHSPVALSSTFICLVFPSYVLICCRDVWVKSPDGSLYIGEVWPGYTVRLIASYLMVSGLMALQVFPDWFSVNVLSFWTDALKNWSELGVGFSGIWLDMNEASSFCSYSWYVVSAVKMSW